MLLGEKFQGPPAHPYFHMVCQLGNRFWAVMNLPSICPKKKKRVLTPFSHTISALKIVLLYELADVTLKGVTFAECVFLLSPAMHSSGLININGGDGCEELNSRRLP